MRVGFAEWPDGLMPSGPTWDAVADAVQAAEPDLLVTDQLPFGPWLAASSRFDHDAATRSIELHEEGVAALASLDVPAVVTSRPVWSGDRLANEGILIEDGRVRFLHRKSVLPDQEGWREVTWYEPGREGFLPADVMGVRVGMLLCTEIMFTEWARHYGASGAELIVVPRATPAITACQTAAAMAAIVSGSYVVSSSRVGRCADGPDFGGRGFAYSPTGALISATSGFGINVVEIEPYLSRRQKSHYPCYLAEPAPRYS